MYRSFHHPLDPEIARAEAAVRRRDQVRTRLARLVRRRGRLRPVTRRRQIARLRAELRALAGVDAALEELLARKERALADAGSPLSADAGAIRAEIERLRALPEDGASLEALVARTRRIQALVRQRRALLAPVCRGLPPFG